MSERASITATGPVSNPPKAKHETSQVSRVLSVAPDLERSSASMTTKSKDEGAMKVTFSWVSMLLFCFTVTSTPAAFSGTIATALYSGGPVAMIWGFLVVWVGSIAGAASLGELCSMYPSAEGQIAWAANLAPPSCRRFVRYYTAWLTCVAWLFMTCSACFICVVSILGIASFLNPSYFLASYHFVLIFWAIMAVAFVFNIGLFSFFGILNTFATTVAVLVTITVVAVVLGMHKGDFNSASFVFTSYINGTGWESKGVVFILGMVGAAYSILGFDAVAHMAEEMHEPEKNAPRAMVGSVLMSLLTGVVFILAVLFSIGDVEALTAYVFPFLGILYDATESKEGSVAILFFLSVVSASAATVSILATSGRVIWSFALEGGLPFSHYFSHVSPRFNVPVRALAASAIIQCLLVLLYLGNSALFNSLLQLAIALLNCSYAIPIALMLFRGRPSGKLKKGPFSLGRFGIVANVVALAYELFISFFLFFPNVRPVTGANMNYAAAIVAFIHLIAGVYWFCGGKTKLVNGSRVEAGGGSEYEK